MTSIVPVSEDHYLTGSLDGFVRSCSLLPNESVETVVQIPESELSVEKIILSHNKSVAIVQSDNAVVFAELLIHAKSNGDGENDDNNNHENKKNFQEIEKNFENKESHSSVSKKKAKIEKRKKTINIVKKAQLDQFLKDLD